MWRLWSPEAIAACSSSDVFDAVIVGARLSGICMLERLVRFGMHVRVYESGSDVGGVWHWNRYPGARADSESWGVSTPDACDGQENNITS